jgi:large subunit ribosomal protein L4
MPTFDVYNLEGKVVGTVDRPSLFETPVDEKLIHRYFVWVRTMLRDTLAHTKTRGDVSGGGKKPWKQKGTGRARVGSSRSPIWRKGGIVFGPRKEQTFATRMPRSERRKALFSALSAKATANSIIVLENWSMEVPKTKTVVELLTKFPTITQKTKVLHVHGYFEPTLFASTSNLQAVSSRTVQNMNMIDIMNHDVLLLTKESMEHLEQHFTANL